MRRLRGVREQIFIDFFGEEADERVFIGDALEKFFAGDVICGGPIFGVAFFVEDFAGWFE